MLGTSSLRSLKLNIKEAYNVMQGECGIDVGDTVRIMRKAECHELGWNTSWPSTMDSYVGKEFTVTENSAKGSADYHYGYGYRVKHLTGYWFPWFVLELVEKKPEVKELTVAEISKRLGYDVKVVK